MADELTITQRAVVGDMRQKLKKMGDPRADNKSAIVKILEISRPKLFPSKKVEKMKKGGAAFPDLTGDGKVTKKDILKGRGVTGFEKGGKAIKESKFGKMGEALMGGLAKSLRKKTGNSISNADKAAVRKLVQETGNKTDRQIMQFEHGGEVRGMGKAYMGPPKKVKIR